MKMPTLDLYLRQERLSRDAIRQRQKNNARRRRKGKPSRNGGAQPRLLRVQPPKHLRFHGTQDQRRAFSDFALKVDSALADGRRVRIDLSDVKQLYPCGLLLFMGQVDTWVSRFPGRLEATYPADNVVEQMLQSVGVLQKLGLPNRVEQISHSDVTMWKYYTGTEADAQEMAPMMDEIRALIGVADQSMLYDSVVEAMTNVRQHAYEGQERTKWWIFATFSDASITVAIYDRGDSIPGTLMRRPGFQEYVARMRAGRKKRDAWLIRMATGGRSRTRLPYRGKGLPEMLESTKAMTGSSLGIYSREGVFQCDARVTPPKFACDRLDFPIVGTLVLWRISLTEVAV